MAQSSLQNRLERWGVSLLYILFLGLISLINVGLGFFPKPIKSLILQLQFCLRIPPDSTLHHLHPNMWGNFFNFYNFFTLLYILEIIMKPNITNAIKILTLQIIYIYKTIHFYHIKEATCLFMFTLQENKKGKVKNMIRYILFKVSQTHFTI